MCFPSLRPHEKHLLIACLSPTLCFPPIKWVKLRLLSHWKQAHKLLCGFQYRPNDEVSIIQVPQGSKARKSRDANTRSSSPTEQHDGKCRVIESPEAYFPSSPWSERPEIIIEEGLSACPQTRPVCNCSLRSGAWHFPEFFSSSPFLQNCCRAKGLLRRANTREPIAPQNERTAPFEELPTAVFSS